MAEVWYFELRKDDDYGGYFDGTPANGMVYRTKESAERARDEFARISDAHRIEREQRDYKQRVEARQLVQLRWDALQREGLQEGSRPADLPPPKPLPQSEIEHQYHVDSYELED